MTTPKGRNLMITEVLNLTTDVTYQIQTSLDGYSWYNHGPFAVSAGALEEAAEILTQVKYAPYIRIARTETVTEKIYSCPDVEYTDAEKANHKKFIDAIMKPDGPVAYGW